jgi:hypothetical protein
MSLLCYNMTIVSAFISNVNNRDDMNLEKYYICGKLLLQVQVPKVIFVDEPMYNKIKDLENELTKIILVHKHHNYLYSYQDQITMFKAINGNFKKNTLEYMFTMCHKTEWMKEAIQSNFFSTDQFIWIDFGIRYVFNCDDLEFNKMIQNVQTKRHSKIRIGSIWDLNIHCRGDIYSHVFWYFAGGVFGGHKDYLLIFSDKMKEKCLEIIQKKRSLMWEVNIWYLIYLENKELFDAYKCNHNESLVTNY